MDSERGDERRAASMAVAWACEQFFNAKSDAAVDAAVDRLAHALDHYISRSTQEWVR